MSSYLEKFKDEVSIIKADVYEKLECKTDLQKFIDLNSKVCKKFDSDQAMSIISKLKSDVADMIQQHNREFKEAKKEMEQEIIASHLDQNNAVSSK